MKVRVLLIACFALISHLAYASHNNFNGPYVGIGLRVVHQSSKFTDTLTADVPSSTIYIPMNKNGSGSANSLLGNLNAGYSKLINPAAYLAFEARINFDSLKSTTSINSATTSGSTLVSQINLSHTLKKLSPSFVVAFKPGILLSPKTSIYGVVGTEVSKFKLSSQATFMLLGSNIAASGSKSSTRYGLLLGAGINSYIYNNISMGLEYNYVNYGKIGTPNPTSTVPGTNDTLSINSKMKVQTNSFIAKLTYHL